MSLHYQISNVIPDAEILSLSSLSSSQVTEKIKAIIAWFGTAHELGSDMVQFSCKELSFLQDFFFKNLSCKETEKDHD